MCSSSSHEYEADRLEALYQYDILDTAPEPVFEELVSLASLIFQTPIALLSLIDEQRQWFKARVGIMPAQLPREMALCTCTIEPDQVLVVSDTLADERFFQHPLVIVKPNIRFFASAPMLNPKGLAIGALCVMDYQPRNVASWQIEALKLLSYQAMRQIELRVHLLTMSQAMLNCSNLFTV